MESTHGWIRTTSDAINSRALYRLSYVGNACLTRPAGARLRRPAALKDSVEKRHVTHRACTRLGIHDDVVPVRQPQRLVVQVLDRAAHVHARVAHHAPPVRAVPD